MEYSTAATAVLEVAVKEGGHRGKVLFVIVQELTYDALTCAQAWLTWFCYIVVIVLHASNDKDCCVLFCFLLSSLLLDIHFSDDRILKCSKKCR